MPRFVLLLAILILALLAFWVGMGCEAWWRHPRDHFWRVCVSIPGLGILAALFFFFLADLPRTRKIAPPPGACRRFV